MHAIRSGIRGLAGASLIALGFAALPARAATGDATSAAGVPVSGPILSGRIYDATGVALPGARVVVEGTGAQATTNLQGEFSVVTPDEAGDVTLLIDYLGRQPVTRVIAAADRGRPVSLTLPAASGEDSDIVVTGASLLDNTARALNQQRTADNTVTIISSDAIGRFPDPNIAEALQRAPGVGIERDQGEGRYINVRGAPSEWSAISVDGIQIPSVDPTTRAVDLDTLPSDIVANLEVTKSLLPYQDADSIAGAVNITTRSPFDRKGFALTGMAGASYNQYGKGSDYRGSGAVSDTFGPDRQFGLLFSGSYSRTHRQPDNVENGWAETPAGLRVTETLFKDYDTKRQRIAGTGAFEWRPSDMTHAWVRGTYARFEDDEFRDRIGILWSEGTLQSGSTDRAATYRNTRIEKQVRHRKQVNEIWSATAGIEQRLGEGTIRADVAYSESSQTYPRRDELLFRSSLRPTLSYDFANADLPNYSLFTTKEHLQTGTFAFRENTYRSNTTKNDELTVAVRSDLPVGDLVTFSTGGKYRERHISADEERFRDRRASAAPTQSLAGLLSDEDSRNFDYDLGKRIDAGLADAYFDATKAASERRLPQSLTADYTAEEKILGLFGMAKYVKDGTILIAGLRVETTDFESRAPSVSRTGAVVTARGHNGYTDFFPNLTLRQAFTPNLILRAALSRAINRPNFPQIAPRVLETTEGNTVRVEFGNPDLKPTLSNNVDGGLEYYIRPLGVISVNGFYKDLSDYRYTLNNTGFYNGVAGAILSRPINARKGELYGVELNWQQHFSFLPGVLSGLGVFANYTYTKGHASFDAVYGGRSRFALPGQSTHMWNASVFYERGPVNLRVAYTKRSDYLDEINADNPALDLYWEGRGQLDVTGSVQLAKGINLFAEGKNLTNTPGVRYFGERFRTYEYEKFGYTLFGGVRVKL
ncbi:MULTISPECIES: TonB-dependent receptor [Sphingomonas]|uniref:TonB-dependent receptor n=1 Tax=Sphingomonas paucimobilis TaxID=13689 RepID=A0A7Y2KPI7_SPHPI|nr:TonB-dependent receptor [Sphingomonas paucimobilis]MCM3681417.1 TonB-dependent receptor [Sphingomonas paucimobilis]NNG56491.1 TonB-dependent receptor [Sphingomonas paucimobilis]